MKIKFAMLAIGAVVTVGACATGVIEPTQDASVDGSVGDSAAIDGAGCPQYDLNTDPLHCGSCTHACAPSEVCSSGKCAAQCNAPTTKCSTDAGVICANVQTDTQHCGQCTNACSVVTDAGLTPGPHNPDAAFPYDGGTGWSLGSAECEGGTCGTTCNNGMTPCSDGICYDTQNYHDHCGNCATACAADTQWCNSGQCCATNEMVCNGACINVLSDKANCGGCGVACSGNKPNCNNGICSATCSPAGTRQSFNTLNSHTTTGCWNGNPCLQGAYAWLMTNGQSFINANEDVVCGGTTACVSHIGITTYELASNCQGAWDVYCDATKVGSINTVGIACQGDAMTNGCDVTFNALTCTTVRFVGTTGSVGACCGSTGLHSMITGVSAW